TFVDGLLETVVIQPNDPNLRLTTNIQRDAFNNVAQVIWSDAHGNTRSQSFEYDSRGIYPLVSYNSRLHPTQYRYDERHGAVTLVADANGIATQYAYDGFGRLREVVAPDGRMTFEFQNASPTADNTLPVNASHKVVTTVNGLPDTEVEMDAFERPVRTKVHGYDGQVVIAENVYFGGLLARAARPHLEGQNEGYTEYSYDSTGRLVNIAYPNGDTLQQLYANRQT